MGYCPLFRFIVCGQSHALLWHVCPHFSFLQTRTSSFAPYLSSFFLFVDKNKPIRSVLVLIFLFCRQGRAILQSIVLKKWHTIRMPFTIYLIRHPTMLTKYLQQILSPTSLPITYWHTPTAYHLTSASDRTPWISMHLFRRLCTCNTAAYSGSSSNRPPPLHYHLQRLRRRNQRQLINILSIAPAWQVIHRLI